MLTSVETCPESRVAMIFLGSIRPGPPGPTVAPMSWCALLSVEVEIGQSPWLQSHLSVAPMPLQNTRRTRHSMHGPKLALPCQGPGYMCVGSDGSGPSQYVMVSTSNCHMHGTLNTTPTTQAFVIAVSVLEAGLETHVRPDWTGTHLRRNYQLDMNARRWANTKAWPRQPDFHP